MSEKESNEFIGVRLPSKLMESIDQFLKTDVAKKNGIFSRADLITRVMGQWLADFDPDYRIFGSGRERESIASSNGKKDRGRAGVFMKKADTNDNEQQQEVIACVIR